MPRKLTGGANRQLNAALPASSRSAPTSKMDLDETISETKGSTTQSRQAASGAKQPIQIRTTINYESELGKAILLEANRINDLAGRNLFSPSKLATEFIRDHNGKLANLFKEFLNAG